MQTKIELFDFDGTLFKNPLDTPENRQKYFEYTGIPWLIDKDTAKELTDKHGRPFSTRKGWYGKAESLRPPLVPDPTPSEMFNNKICERFLESKENSEVLTVLMTGRHAGIANEVLRICHDGGLIKCEQHNNYYKNIDFSLDVWFFGQNGPNPIKAKPKNPSTLEWKMWILEQYVGPQTIEIWEDRIEHVEAFGQLTFFSQVIVNHVE